MYKRSHRRLNQNINWRLSPLIILHYGCARGEEGIILRTKMAYVRRKTHRAPGAGAIACCSIFECTIRRNCDEDGMYKRSYQRLNQKGDTHPTDYLTYDCTRRYRLRYRVETCIFFAHSILRILQIQNTPTLCTVRATGSHHKKPANVNAR